MTFRAAGASARSHTEIRIYAYKYKHMFGIISQKSGN